MLRGNRTVNIKNAQVYLLANNSYNLNRRKMSWLELKYRYSCKTYLENWAN